MDWQKLSILLYKKTDMVLSKEEVLKLFDCNTINMVECNKKNLEFHIFSCSDLFPYDEISENSFGIEKHKVHYETVKVKK